MAYQEPDVYIKVDASALAQTELPNGGNALILGTANKGALNTPIAIGKEHFAAKGYEEQSYGSIGASSGSNPISLVRAAQLATRDSGAYVWAVRVATNLAASASGTMENLTDGWGIDLSSYYKGTWYEGSAIVASNSDGTLKMSLNGSSTSNFTGWYEVWDKIPNDTTASGATDIINGVYVDEDAIEYSNWGTFGQFDSAYTVNNTITPTVQGSVFFTATVASGSDVTLSTTSACNIADGNDGEIVTADDIELVHRTYFAQEPKYDILHFAGMKIDDCNTQIKSAIDHAELERAWRIGVQGVDEPSTKTPAQAVITYTTDTTTHEKGYLIKWASCWTEYDDPYEMGTYDTNAQQIDLDSKFTAAWFIGELVSPNANGIVDESEPKTGVIVDEKAKYSWNRTQKDRLIRAKVTITEKEGNTSSKVKRSQTAYGIGSDASSWRNPNVVRLINQLKKSVVDLGRKFTIKTKNLPRNRLALKNGLKKILDLYIEMEKITEYSGLKVYASPDDEINGIVRVDFNVRPVQPVLFILVNMILE